MQKPDPNKRSEILKVAERLFAAKPFHEVKLDEVAAKARIGKGTIYIYFKNKEDLYVCLIRDGMSSLIVQLQQQLVQKHRTSEEELRLIVTGLVEFAAGRPNMYQLLRTVLPKPCEGQMSLLRRQLEDLIRDVIRGGIARREMQDPRPELTAQFIMASVRGGMLFGPEKLTAEELIEHTMRIFGLALKRGTCSKEKHS